MRTYRLGTILQARIDGPECIPCGAGTLFVVRKTGLRPLKPAAMRECYRKNIWLFSYLPDVWRVVRKRIKK